MPGPGKSAARAFTAYVACPGPDASDADEVRHVRGTARRIAALLLLGDDLDRNYAAVA